MEYNTEIECELDARNQHDNDKCTCEICSRSRRMEIARGHTPSNKHQTFLDKHGKFDMDKWERALAQSLNLQMSPKEDSVKRPQSRTLSKKL